MPARKARGPLAYQKQTCRLFQESRCGLRACAVRQKHMNAALPTAVHIALHANLYAIRHAWLVAWCFGKQASVTYRAVSRYVTYKNATPRAVVHVQQRFNQAKTQTVGLFQVNIQSPQLVTSRINAVHAAVCKLRCVRHSVRCPAAKNRVGKPNSAVAFHHSVVGTVQLQSQVLPLAMQLSRRCSVAPYCASHGTGSFRWCR